MADQLKGLVLISQKTIGNKINLKYKDVRTGNTKIIKRLIPDPESDDEKDSNVEPKICPFLVDKPIVKLENGLKFADWFDKKIANTMNRPINGTYKKVGHKTNFGKPDFENKYCNHFEYTRKTNNYGFDNFVPDSTEAQKKSLKTYNTKIVKEVETIGKDKTGNPNTSTKLKSLLTQKANLEIKMANVIKTSKYELFPNEKQHKTLQKWIKSNDLCYDTCVDLYNDNNKYFDTGYKHKKVDVFKFIDKDAPYDVLTDEVRKFCSNLKSCRSNLKNGHIKHFDMKHINKLSNERTFMVPKTSVKNGSIYKSILGKMSGLEELPKIMCDCSITYNRAKNKYWLNVPTITTRKKPSIKREAVAGLDEGEVVFVAYHGENTFGEIGRGLRKRVLGNINECERLQKILDRKKNKDDTRLKNRHSLKLRRQRKYEEVKHFVKEMHNKTALFLVTHFDRVMIPKFETRGMLRNRKYDKAFYNKLKEEKGIDEMKKVLRETTKKKRLNKKVKKVLNMMRHYGFKQHLVNKGNEYGCIVDTEVNENETTMTCANCGCKEYFLHGRIRECKNCSCKIDRDNNASFLTILKNVKNEELKMFQKKPPK